MGLLDKVKAQAEAAAAKAQQGIAQGKDKLDTMQAQRALDGLLRTLGAAYYDQQRHDGSASSVSDALAAVDAHVAANPPEADS